MQPSNMAKNSLQALNNTLLFQNIQHLTKQPPKPRKYAYSHSYR